MTPEQVLVIPPKVLTDRQRESYFANGYLLVEKAIPEDTVERLRRGIWSRTTRPSARNCGGCRARATTTRPIGISPPNPWWRTSSPIWSGPMSSFTTRS